MQTTIFKPSKSFKIMLYIFPLVPIMMVVFTYLIKYKLGMLYEGASFWENIEFITTIHLSTFMISGIFWIYYCFYAISRVELTDQSVLIKSQWGRKKELPISSLKSVTLGETYISLRQKEGDNISFQAATFNKATKKQIVEAINEQITKHK